ncbi:hypothetical protein BHE74_00012382 [Ensete ventricosum]|nr:hypothetical protein BHE74_00012382 [Ensete ventricosum]
MRQRLGGRLCKLSTADEQFITDTSYPLDRWKLLKCKNTSTSSLHSLPITKAYVQNAIPTLKAPRTFETLRNETVAGFYVKSLRSRDSLSDMCVSCTRRTVSEDGRVSFGPTPNCKVSDKRFPVAMGPDGGPYHATEGETDHKRAVEFHVRRSALLHADGLRVRYPFSAPANEMTKIGMRC